MFQPSLQNYSITDASMEIFVILIGAFILGMVLGWLLKPVPEIFIEGSEEPQEKKSKKHIQVGDDLILIEGIDSVMLKFLQKNGIHDFKGIVREDVAGLEALLLDGGKKYADYNPATWPDQAELAMKGKWSELEEYQEILIKNHKK